MGLFSFWKLIIFIFIPLAVSYQLLWDYFLSSRPQQFWLNGSYTKMYIIKAVGELIMYSSMLYYLSEHAVPTSKKSLFMVGGVLAAVILYTGFCLIAG